LSDRSAVVLGAGLQGALVSIALARAGYAITLVDEAPDCLLRASSTNEGKIHLGFVYAHDPSRRTAAVMLEAAMAFEPLLEEWLGTPLSWDALTTGPFSYAVLHDSLVPAADLERAWEALQATYEAAWPSGSGRYLGTRPARLWWHPRDAHGARACLSGRVSAVVETAERSVDLPALRALVKSRLRSVGGVCHRFGHHVRAVRRTPTGFAVEGTADGRVWHLETPIVVNCLWAGRLAIDREMGVCPRRPWVYRLKYRLLGRLPDRLRHVPSLTMMLGRFGDIVNYGDGRVYLSWYPACLRGWSSDVEIPADWRPSCERGVPLAEASGIIDESLSGLDAIVPGLGECTIDSVAAGVIFSWGRTDIDDLSSELHRRDDIGPEAHDGYITVNTGKLTSAPLFARRVADLLR
jgi:glycine/D-amino acid oxidase-like deaminating enzyme